MFLTGHPIDFYEPDLKALIGSRIARLSLDNVREIRGRRGGGKESDGGRYGGGGQPPQYQRGPMASVLLDDKTGRIRRRCSVRPMSSFETRLPPTGSWWLRAPWHTMNTVVA